MAAELPGVVFADITESEREQIAVLREAFLKFRERNKKYKDLWKEGGANDSEHHIHSKSSRIRMQIMALDDGEEFDEDDALDLINYAVFFIRNVRDGRVG